MQAISAQRPARDPTLTNGSSSPPCRAASCAELVESTGVQSTSAKPRFKCRKNRPPATNTATE